MGTIGAIKPVQEHRFTKTGLVGTDLSIDEMMAWVTLPSCGAVVTFTGTVREHSRDSTGRITGGVTSIDYEAYLRAAHERLAEIADAARSRWPDVGRVALVHRIGLVSIGQPAVVVCVSAGHRTAAFLAAQFCIDLVKSTVPVWKREMRDVADSWVETGAKIETVAAAGARWTPASDGEQA